MHEAHRLPEESQGAITDIMTRIRCIRVFNAFALVNGLQQLRDLLEKKTQHDEFTSKLKLVIIDSLGSLISPLLSSKQTMGHGVMLEVSRIMKAIAREHHIAFVVTNYAVTKVCSREVMPWPIANGHLCQDINASADLKPGLGEAWGYIPNSQLTFRQMSRTEKIEALLTKSTHNVRAFDCLVTELCLG
jgi:hypothetical protein